MGTFWPDKNYPPDWHIQHCFLEAIFSLEADTKGLKLKGRLSDCPPNFDSG